MSLLNYSTKVPASKTIGEMQAKLAKAGATHIAMKYEGGEPEGLAFAIETPYGTQSFELPVDWRRVDKVLYSQGHAYEEPRVRRVAWRILKDWLEAQLALIETEMVTLDQVMLPYMKGEGGRSVYELIVEQQTALPKGPA